MSARFEIVRTDAAQPWHARFRAANGRIIWTTENYTRRSGSVYAIDGMARMFSPTNQVWLSTVREAGVISIDLRYGSEGHSMWSTAHRVEIREIDERSKP